MEGNFVIAPGTLPWQYPLNAIKTAGYYFLSVYNFMVLFKTSGVLHFSAPAGYWIALFGKEESVCFSII